MITRIPALEFMQGLVGTYRAQAEQVELKVWRCGYGVAIELSSQSKVQMVGVIGACGPGIECFAQFGLPNVVRLHTQAKSGNGVVFQAEEPPIELGLSSQGSSVEFHLWLAGHEKASHVLHRSA